MAENTSELSSVSKQSEESILEALGETGLPEIEFVGTSAVHPDEPATKKARKPFVFTEKRKQAFERCRELRAQKVAERLKALSETQVSQNHPRWKVLRELRRLRQQLDLTTKQIDENPHSLPQSQEVVQAKNLEIVSHMPNQASAVQEAPLPTPPSVPTADQSLQGLKVSVRPVSEIATSYLSQKPPSNSSSTPVSSMEAIHSPQEMSTSNEEEGDTYMQQTTQQRKRKHVEFDDQVHVREYQGQSSQDAENDMDEEDLQHYHQGVGAGNHPPFAETSSRYQQVVDPSKLDDDTLIALLQEARSRQQRQSMFDQRRVESKVARPDNASMFLDTVQSFQSYPSQLFNTNSLYVRGNQGQSQQAQPSSHKSGYVWL
jgi:hypothetical protein